MVYHSRIMISSCCLHGHNGFVWWKIGWEVGIVFKLARGWDIEHKQKCHILTACIIISDMDYHKLLCLLFRGIERVPFESHLPLDFCYENENVRVLCMIWYAVSDMFGNTLMISVSFLRIDMDAFFYYVTASPFRYKWISYPLIISLSSIIWIVRCEDCVYVICLMTSLFTHLKSDYSLRIVAVPTSHRRNGTRNISVLGQKAIGRVKLVLLVALMRRWSVGLVDWAWFDAANSNQDHTLFPMFCFASCFLKKKYATFTLVGIRILIGAMLSV